MKINLLLSYDVTISSHREETKEVEFSIEDFKEYFGEYFGDYPPSDKEDLRVMLLDYFMDSQLDIPTSKESEDIDWDTFRTNISNFEEILPELQHLIKE